MSGAGCLNDLGEALFRPGMISGVVYLLLHRRSVVTSTISQMSFWKSHGVLNIITEVALVVLPTYTM